jgi:hypothetical protein
LFCSKIPASLVFYIIDTSVGSVRNMGDSIKKT